MIRPTTTVCILALSLFMHYGDAFMPSLLRTRPASRTCMASGDLNEVTESQHIVKKSASSLLGFIAPALVLLGATFSCPMDSFAISGGGKDYAEAKINGQDFSGKDFTGKDFSGSFAQQTTFKNSKLRGTRFYKAALKEADFTGADLTGASLEGASLDGAIFDNALVSGAYFTETVSRAGSIKGSDWTDTLLRPDVQKKLCGMASGTNPATGVDTKESLLCD